MTATRYTIARGKFGTPIVYDTQGKYAVGVFPRAHAGDEVTEAEDVDAMGKARIAAAALNRADAELVWKAQQEGGRR
jgi:hypothetical protein